MRRCFGPDLQTQSKRTFVSDNVLKEHIIRRLRNYTKICIHFYQANWTDETIETQYYPDCGKVFLVYHGFRILDTEVQSVKSLKSFTWAEERILEYYNQHITKQPIKVYRV